VPVAVWQSAQWHTCVFFGSASASTLMAPQLQASSTFMKNLLAVFFGEFLLQIFKRPIPC
jgi:hypothetical protein